MNKKERESYRISTGVDKLEEGHYFAIVTQFCEILNDAYADVDDEGESRKWDMLQETMKRHLSPEAFKYVMDVGF